MSLGERWRVDPREPIWLTTRSPWEGAADLPQGAEILGVALAVALVSTWFPEGWLSDDRMLAEICLSVEGAFPGGDSPDGGWLRATARRALEDGRLVAVRMPFDGPGEAFAEEEDPVTARQPAKEEKTWIEIVLMDDDKPPHPVPFVKYRIELPNGSPREGVLDANGRARLDGIEPGECHVSFPGLDAREWRRA